MVKVMGSSLDGYADLIVKPQDRTPALARIAPESGLGWHCSLKRDEQWKGGHGDLESDYSQALKTLLGRVK